jgi:hypothetical protein
VDVLTGIHGRDCAQVLARQVVDVAFTAGWRPAPPGAMDGVLRVGPTRGRAVRVSAVEGTTLFAISAAGLPLTVAAGSEPVNVPVTVTPQRCDAHAIGESKRGYAFGVRVAAGGLDEVRLTVEPDASGRAALQTALLDACGLAP